MHKDFILLVEFVAVQTDLEKVGSDTFVGALLGHLFGEPCDFIRRLSDVFGALNEGAFVSTDSTHQAGHFRHQQSHAFGRTDDVISLNHRNMVSLLLRCLTLLLCSLTLLDHLRASSWSCLAATMMGSLTTSPAFCSGNSSSFSSGGGGLGGGTSPSGRGGLGGASSSLSCKDMFYILV